MVNFDNIKRAASNMKDAVLDLIIGDCRRKMFER